MINENRLHFEEISHVLDKHIQAQYTSYYDYETYYAERYCDIQNICKYFCITDDYDNPYQGKLNEDMYDAYLNGILSKSMINTILSNAERRIVESIDLVNAVSKVSDRYKYVDESPFDDIGDDFDTILKAYGGNSHTCKILVILTCKSIIEILNDCDEYAHQGLLINIGVLHGKAEQLRLRKGVSAR